MIFRKVSPAVTITTYNAIESGQGEIELTDDGRNEYVMFACNGNYFGLPRGFINPVINILLEIEKANGSNYQGLEIFDNDGSGTD